MYVVVMIEPTKPREAYLPVSSQINEVFGPFTEQEADAWVKRAKPLFPKDRRWLVIPLSDGSVLNRLDPTMN